MSRLRSRPTALAVGLATTSVVLIGVRDVPRSTAADGPVAANARPILGIPARGIHLLGVAGGDTWAYGRLGSVPARVDGKRIPESGTAELTNVLLRSGGVGQWRVVADLSAAGGDAGGFGPIGLLGDSSITPAGIAAILGTTSKRATGDGTPAAAAPALVVRAADGALRTAPVLEREIEPAEPTPEPTPDPAEPTPEPTPEETAEATPETTPEATPEVTPDTTPDATQSEASTTPDDQAAASTPDDPTPEPTVAVAEAAADATPEAATPGAEPTETPAPTATPTPDDGTVRLAPDEHLYSGSRRIVMAVDEPGGKAGALLGAVRDGIVEDSILHFDGTSWSREPVELGDRLRAAGFRFVALAGTGLDDAWLLGRADPQTRRGIMLFHRDPDGHWREQDLGETPFAVRAPEGTEIDGIEARRQPAQALTSTPSALWVDGTMLSGTRTLPFTLYFDKSSRRITGSWCAVDLCDHDLDAGLDDETGYRSFAWDSGGSFGSRVITNPLSVPDAPGTGRGTYLALHGTAFDRVAGLGRSAAGADAAFASADDGWMVPATSADPDLEASAGLVRVSSSGAAASPQEWPLAFRRPLQAVTPEPGRSAGDPSAAALAVGVDGTVARFSASRGWAPEFLQSSAGQRQTPDLTGVAWPTAGRAHVVGQDGAMWLWRATTGLWEPDPGAPLDFDGNLLDIAFDPSNPDRGYAVGRQGVLLRYGKRWTQEPLPAEIADKDLLGIAFAGSQALVAWRAPDGTSSGLLVGSPGKPWVVENQASALATSSAGSLLAVAGLPDGGAVAAGAGTVLIRDSATAPWRLSDAPLTGLTAVAVAATRDGDVVRPVVSAWPAPPGGYPANEPLVITPPGQSPQLYPSVPPPLRGALLRETADGWSDETRRDVEVDAADDGSDPPSQSDQAYALSLDPSGRGWVVGGKVVATDDSTQSVTARRLRQTASASRLPADPSSAPALADKAAVPMTPGLVRFAIGGQATCRAACADEANVGIAPDVGLQAAIDAVGSAAAQESGPRAFIATGPRLAGGDLTRREGRRWASVATPSSSLPVYVVPGQESAFAGADAFTAAFAGFPAPFGQGPPPAGVSAAAALPGVAPRVGEARKHYAFDSVGPEGTVRVVVIDNAAGSLNDSDLSARPRDVSQAEWLAATLQASRDAGIPTIVIGDRDLDTQSGGDHIATDATFEAQILKDGAVSAYFFDSPNQNRISSIPAGEPGGVPAFGSGTLGYSSSPVGPQSPYYGESGYLLAEIDVTKRDPATNRVPVSARLIPVLGDLAIDADDGTLLPRSTVASFTSLGRRPEMGGIDPYIQMPADSCKVISCPGRIEPEYRFSSSNPDIADFVRRDVDAADPKAVFLGTDDKPISDATSGLLCAFNAGTTTISVEAGGRVYRSLVTVRAGAVARPCGTRKLVNPPRRAVPPPVAPVAPAAVAPAGSSPPIAPVPPIPVAPAGPVPPAPAVPVAAAAAPPLLIPIPPVFPPAAPLPPPSLARPLSPPGTTGVTITNPVTQVEEKREEEEAFESSSAYAQALPPGEGRNIGGGLLMVIVIAGAGLGATTARGWRQGAIRRVPAYTDPRSRPTPPANRSRRSTHSRRLP